MYSQELFDVQCLLTVFDRPISYHKCLAEMCGSVTAGVMLSQMIYWTPRTSDGDRWFYKNMDEWQKETALTRTEQESARKKLKSLGILEEKKEGVPCKLFFRVDLKQLAKCLNLFNSPVCRNAANKDESSLQTGKQVSRKQASRNLADNLYTEITTETTDIRADDIFVNTSSPQEQENFLPVQTTPRIEEPPKPQSPFPPAAPEINLKDILVDPFVRKMNLKQREISVKAWLEDEDFLNYLIPILKRSEYYKSGCSFSDVKAHIRKVYNHAIADADQKHEQLCDRHDEYLSGKLRKQKQQALIITPQVQESVPQVDPAIRQRFVDEARRKIAQQAA